MVDKRKRQQVSNAVAIDRLIKAFNGLLEKLAQKDEQNLVYFAAIADALNTSFPEKFTDEFGKPKNIYLEYLKKTHPEAFKQQSPDISDQIKILGLGDNNANT